MCGISFYCSSIKNFADSLQESLLKTKHRGPDSSGIYQKKAGNYFVGLGHNRLSILDLSEAGHQPMDIGCGIIISYNGEIYNHQELRLVLERKGCSFRSNTDTEVILLLYLEFGQASFAMLKGMFSFVLLDENKNKLIIVRDAVGIKPLYLYQDNTGIFGSSEIRGLKSFSAVNFALDHNDIYEFFNNGFLYEPATGYTFIKKLMPGQFIEFDLVNGLQEQHYFASISNYQTTLSLQDKIKSAIDRQIVADVPVGTFFSGGTDSSIIAAYVKKNSLLFAKYNDNEGDNIDLLFSKKIADYLSKPLVISEINQVSDNRDDIMETIEFVAANSEELISDYTFLSTYLLSMSAKKNGYKVMLSGMGGDEAFAGYPRYLILKWHRIIKTISPVINAALKLNLFPRKWNKKFERLASYSTENHWPTAYSRLLGYFSRLELQSFFNDSNTLEANYRNKLDAIASRYEGKKSDKIKMAQYFDLSGFLSHNLMVSDKASMLASIELRVPLLDESVLAHGLALPTRLLVPGWKLKQPLKAILSALLPKKLVKRPKTGFNPPLDGLIKKIGIERLQKEFSHASQIINTESTSALLEDHFTGKSNNTYKLWQLLYFSCWIKQQTL